MMINQAWGIQKTVESRKNLTHKYESWKWMMKFRKQSYKFQKFKIPLIECEGSKSCKTKYQQWTFLIKKLSICARKIPNLSYEIFKKARKQVKAAKLSNLHQKVFFIKNYKKRIKNLDPNFEWLNNYFYFIFFKNKNGYN